jgi:hypothetical protein
VNPALPPQRPDAPLATLALHTRAAGVADVARTLDRVALDLLELARDVTGYRTAFRAADGPSALRLLTRGAWHRAALRGGGRTVYPGDLELRGRLAAQARALEDARSLAARYPHTAATLEPGLRHLDDALGLLITTATPRLCRLSHALDAWLARRGSRQAAAKGKMVHPVTRRGTRSAKVRKADIRRRFRFRSWTSGGLVYKEARGRLGVPGRVQTFRCRSAHEAVKAAFPDDDAGHLIAAVFGAPGDGRNLAPQTPVLQRNVKPAPDALPIPPVYRMIERKWEALLAAGHGVVVRVVDVVGAQSPRSSGRRVYWTQIDPDGQPTHFTEYPGNFPYIDPAERRRRAMQRSEE